MLWALTSALAQTTIQGTITDNDSGEPIPFVTIFNTENKEHTTSDIKGGFSIITSSNSDKLRLTYLGYQEQEIAAGNASSIKLRPSLLKLDEVVVSVNREQEKRTETPVAISSISAKTQEQNKATTIDQILNQTAGVYMVDLGNEQHTMSIRRPIDYGASYLYLEDGVPIRTSGVFNHNALLEINMANTSRVEIIRGPASSMYGSEAIGGAINFISIKPTISPTAGVSIQGNNIGYRRTEFYASNTFKDKVGIRLAGYYANQRDGVIEHSDFDKLALSLSANYFLSNKTEIVWSNSLIDYYSDMSGSLDSTDFYNESYSSNQTFTNRQVDAFRSKIALNHYWSESAKSTFTGYFRSNSVKQTPSYRVSDDYIPWTDVGDQNLAHGEVNDNSFESYGLITQHKKDLNIMNGSIIIGGSLDYSPNTYEAEYISINKTDAGTYDSFISMDSLLADYEADLFNIASYAKVKLQPLEGLNIIGAIRYDQFNYDFNNHLDSTAYTAVLDGKNTFSRFTPKLGLTYDLANNRGIYANYSQGFVPPQVTELYRGNEIPSLKPVYYENFEVGGWLTFAKEKGKLEVSLYRMDGSDEIISVLQDNGTTVRQNAGKTRHQGIEYALNLLPVQGLKIRVSGTNAMHEFIDFDESGTDYSGNDMPRAPKWVANVQATYQPSYLAGFRVSVEWQHIDKYFMDQTNEKVYNGYDIFNIRMGYEWKSFEVWANIINASDELYATVASASAWGQTYSLGKPRSINIGLAYKFQGK